MALGPLTNIALAFEKDESIKKDIRSIYLMGGAMNVPGNVFVPGVNETINKSAEWNMFCDS